MNVTQETTTTTGVEEKFVPKGAIAFFIILILICLAIWFGIYYIMISRS
ncbi:MAG: cytochrome c oxidase subunit 2A [Ginsengibacter sp.]